MLPGLLITLTCLVTLLAIPVDVTFVLRRHKTLHTQLKVAWLFGLVQLPLRKQGIGAATRRHRPEKPPRERIKTAKRLLAMLKIRGFKARLVKLFIELWKAIHKRSLHLWMRFGLDDPADTGIFWGFVGSFQMMLAAPRGIDIALEPSFDGAVFQLDSCGQIRLIPVQLIYIAIVFVISPVTLRALRAAYSVGKQ